jgi:hypothetical protein
MQRDAVAAGTVVVDGSTLVSGPTTNAFIRTFEDRNATTGQAQVEGGPRRAGPAPQ